MKNTFRRSEFRGTSRLAVACAAGIITLSFAVHAQSPSPSPSAESEGKYSVKASTEIGGRWVDVNGNENKFRSDLNYRSGFRVFDSSIVIENNRKGSKSFDSAMFIASGWGADPSGMFRTNVEKTGLYRLDGNFRRVGFFNNLNNHAIGETKINYHNYRTSRNFGDVDLVLLPENQKIRFRLGGSYNLSGDTFTYSSRQSEVFPIQATARAKAYDFRFGADGQVLGFNLSATYGYRSFSDRTSYLLLAPDEGDRVSTTDIDKMERTNPITGRTHFGVFNLQRTFAERFDITAKILHSWTTNEFKWNEFIEYRTPVFNRDEYTISGNSSRPQTRGDLGMTWRIADKFRLSNTFSYDGFNLSGGNLYAQIVFRTNVLTRNSNFTVTRYRKYTNTFEGDYQFNDRVGVNLGYRYTHRDIDLQWIGLNLANLAPLTGSPALESAKNSTNTVIAGTRIKPTKNWAIYADVEKGKADNVFTRAGNSDFTNFRVRSRMRFSKVASSISFISKDNEIPAEGTNGPDPRYITDTKSRTFSATVDWFPINEVNLSGGYNYVNLTSEAFIKLPINGVLTDGLSQYFVRDNYIFIDATVKPHKRVSLFASYRWDKDNGHGDRALPPLASSLIIGSYPIDFKTPEVKASFRLSKYVDWNIGYQYYDYKEDPPQQTIYGLASQNYSAHMPYMSVRIYLGKGSADR